MIPMPHPNNNQKTINFARIAKAIRYIQANVKTQPTLEHIANHIHLSTSHVQRMFTEWAGISPKQFLQYVTIEHAKDVLAERKTSLLEASVKTGLSGSGRLHDLFIKIEGMTPGEYKNGGASLSINYSIQQSPFGTILIASTSKGICHLAFAENQKRGFEHLHQRFPHATFKKAFDLFQQNALRIFDRDWNKLSESKFHLKGTEFQLKVWEALLTIPPGQLRTYGMIAEQIQYPNAYRAVGTAVGQNPVAFLIPCHRIIQSSGVLGTYHWGSDRKTAIIGWEAAEYTN